MLVLGEVSRPSLPGSACRGRPLPFPRPVSAGSSPGVVNSRCWWEVIRWGKGDAGHSSSLRLWVRPPEQMLPLAWFLAGTPPVVGLSWGEPSTSAGGQDCLPPPFRWKPRVVFILHSRFLVLDSLFSFFNWRIVALQFVLVFAVQQHESVITIYIITTCKASA